MVVEVRGSRNRASLGPAGLIGVVGRLDNTEDRGRLYAEDLFDGGSSTALDAMD